MLWIRKQDLTGVTAIKVEAAEVKQQITALVAHEVTGEAQLRPLHALEPELETLSSLLRPQKLG